MERTTDIEHEWERARAALAAAPGAEEPYGPIRAMGVFMGFLGTLGRRVQARELAPDAQASFIEVTAPLLDQAEGPLALWLSDLDSRLMLSLDFDGYERTLHERSALQLLLDWYGDTAAGGLVEGIEVEDIDETLRAHAPAFGALPAPPGTPPHHWWWATPQAR